MLSVETVIIINDYAEVKGGAAKVAIDSAYGVAEKGYKVVFIYATGGYSDKLVHSNITLYNLDQYVILESSSRCRAAVSGIWNKSVFYKLSGILEKFDNRKSIVHVHSWVKSLSISAIDAVVRLDFLNVITLHDYFSVCPNGGLFNYKKNSVCNLKPMSLRCIISNCDSRNYTYKVWRVIRQIFYSYAGMPNKTKNFITVSNFSKLIVKEFLPKDINIWDIPNPISTVKRPSAKPSSSKHYTFVGRLSAEKGLMLLPQLKLLPASRIRFIGVGELEDTLRAELPDAEFLGWQSEDCVAQYLYESRALLFLSDWYETQGLVVLEAAALGIPAIVASDTAAADYVENNTTGLIFEKGNITDLEEKIFLLEDDCYVDKLGLSAYENYWMSPLSISLHVDYLLSCYADILKNSQ